MRDDNKTAVVLFNLGGPDSLDAIEPFLYNLFSDPDIINFPLSFLVRKRLARYISSKRAPKVQVQYERIGGKSPILELSTKQANLLEVRLNKSMNAKVFLAMRYWKPFTADTIAEVEKYDPSKIIFLPLYPHYSIATTASSMNEWKKQVASNEKVKNIPSFLVEKYPTNDLYIQSFIERINAGLAKFPAERKENVTVLFSAHGTPVKLVKIGDPYSYQIKETVETIKDTMKMKQPNRLCFQSKVGPQKWLTPSTPATILEVSKLGVKDLLMVPVAFTSDHLETLFELNVEYRHLAKENGIENFEVTEGLNDSPTFISALEQLVLEKIAAIPKEANIR